MYRSSVILCLLCWCCCGLVGLPSAQATMTVHRHDEVGRQMTTTTTTTGMLRRDSSGAAIDGQHRKLAFWGWAFLVNLVHCPPIGKKHDECMAARSSSSSGGGGGASSSSSSGGDDVDSDSVESMSEGGGVSGTSLGGSRQAAMIGMWIAAAVAACLAVAAVYWGTRKIANRGHAHQLSGSIARRMGLFGALCSAAAFRCGRPTRHAEKKMVNDDDNATVDTNNEYKIMTGNGGPPEGGKETVAQLQQVPQSATV